MKTAPSSPDAHSLHINIPPRVAQRRTTPLDLLDVEDVNQAKLQETQEHLERIRRQHEEINALRQQLETRQQKQSLFAQGRREWIDKLNKSLLGVDREIHETEKLLEQLQNTRDAFSRHVTVLRSFHPEHWSEDDIQDQLDLALTAVEEASEEHQKLTARIQSLRQAAGVSPVSGAGFLKSLPAAADCFRIGLAFTAPLMAFGFVMFLLSKIFS